MSDMTTFRKFLGGYKLIKADTYRDISYGDSGVLITQLLYRSRHGRLVKKDIYGSYKLHDLLDEPKQPNKVFPGTKNFKICTDPACSDYGGKPNGTHAHPVEPKGDKK